METALTFSALTTLVLWYIIKNLYLHEKPRPLEEVSMTFLAKKAAFQR